jgi:hypothetical protein
VRDESKKNQYRAGFKTLSLGVYEAFFSKIEFVH